LHLHPAERADSTYAEPGSSRTGAPRVQHSRVHVGAAGLAVLAVFGLLLGFRWHDSQPYSGDEPHYLVVSESLIHDGDVDVKNDYLTRRYRAYYAGHLDPHVNTSIFTTASPHWYSMHGVGLSAVLVPGVWAEGARGGAVTMIGIAVVVLVLTFLWAQRFTGVAWPAAIATGALAVSPFFLGLEGRIFPDLAAAALLLGCLLLLELPSRRSRHLLLLGTLVGLSPWFHFKNALPSGTVAAIAFVQVMRSSRGRERIRALVALAAPILVALIGYELSVRAWYASWLPTHMVQGGNTLFAISGARGLAAVSFDSARGLFTNNPALLLIFAGFPVWLRRCPGPVLRLAVIVGPSILLEATFSDWAGAYAPAGRYALQFIPAFIPAIALLLREAPLLVRAAASALIGLQSMLALAVLWLRPSWGVGGERSPLFTAIDKHLGAALDHAMPSFDNYTALVHRPWQLAAWLLVSGLFVAYGTRLAWRPVRGAAYAARASPP
jgi:hypothetical protein